MGISYRNGISILELIIYFPSVFVGGYLVIRHGLRKSAGFIYLVLFSNLRIVGACCDLATISNPSTGLYISEVICSSIGLSPLILTCSGFLARANESIHEKTPSPSPSPSHPLLIPRPSFMLLSLLTLSSLIICIVGITLDMTPSALLHPNTEIKVAMILFLTAWVVLCLILGLLVQKRAEIHKGECRILSVVGVSAVLILVRLVYVLLVFFKADKTFNMLNGNMTVLLVMSVLEETGVVVLCLGVGLTLRVRGGGTGAGAGATKEELAYSHVPLVETGYQPYGQR